MNLYAFNLKLLLLALAKEFCSINIHASTNMSTIYVPRRIDCAIAAEWKTKFRIKFNQLSYVLCALHTTRTQLKMSPIYYVVSDGNIIFGNSLLKRSMERKTPFIGSPFVSISLQRLIDSDLIIFNLPKRNLIQSGNSGEVIM